MHVAVVGLGFGSDFVPIYVAHPKVSRVTICDLNVESVDRVQSANPSVSVDTFESILSDPGIDTVHLLTPLPLHVEHTLQVLAAGKHCACAVTMASTVADLRQVISAVRKASKNYMMMETGVYTREYLFARDMLDRGQLGQITFLRGDYYQDLEAPYANYWRSVPPILYATHCVGPIFALADSRATRVSCVGSGRLRQDISDDPQNPFPLQTANFILESTSAVAQVNRAWYQTAHPYVESFSVYGDTRGFEWQQLDHEDPVIFELEPVQNDYRWRGCRTDRVEVPFRPDLLPAELEPFAAGGHGGSHAHLVHEFVTSIDQGRPSIINELVAANWCAAGICAHESSLNEGAWIDIPGFDQD